MVRKLLTLPNKKHCGSRCSVKKGTESKSCHEKQLGKMFPKITLLLIEKVKEYSYTIL